MVQVLPYIPSPLEQIIPHLGQAASDIGSGFKQRAAVKALESVLNPQLQSQNNQNKSAPGQEIQQNPSFSPVNIASIARLAEGAYGKTATDALVNSLITQQKHQDKSTLQEKQFENQRAEKAEPELLERENKLNNYEQEGIRFERLQNLFSPELEKKFPSSFTVGLLTKDGELNSRAAALLSPEAQEAVKLVADNLSGAKDTFGARVTNFDLQAYMKRLPTLLNSAEGRRRVLRDLRIMNQLNTMHQRGVLEIVEREGGPGKISLSQAERRYRKENSKEISNLKKEFVHPEKHAFSERPNPQVYSGRVIVDESTGEKFRSNGKEWIPE